MLVPEDHGDRSPRSLLIWIVMGEIPRLGRFALSFGMSQGRARDSTKGAWMSFIYIGDGKMLSMKNEMILEKVASVLGQFDRLVAAYLFGSRANGDYGPGSDVDIGVLFEEELGLARVVRIEQAMEEAIGLPVDVLDLRRASSFLALDIVRGIRILCHEETLCDEFELFVLSRAGDLAFFERQRRAVLLGKEA